MIWIVIIVIILIIIFYFFASKEKDVHDLSDKTLEEKFQVIVDLINESAFNHKGKVTILDKWSFNLYEEGQNQIVNFSYSTGHLTIIWKYKFLQKEIVHERTYNDVRNLSIIEQTRIGNHLIQEMNEMIQNHKKSVLDSTEQYQLESSSLDQLKIITFKTGLEKDYIQFIDTMIEKYSQEFENDKNRMILHLSAAFNRRIKEGYNELMYILKNTNGFDLSREEFDKLVDEVGNDITIKYINRFS